MFYINKIDPYYTINRLLYERKLRSKYASIVVLYVKTEDLNR